MLSFALIPLSLYFFFLSALSLRERPTVLNGIQDWMLLCSGVAGLLAFGPGKLLIPVRLYVFWGINIWAFWFLFYILTAYIIAKHFLPKRIVIYGCAPETFIAIVKETAGILDPQSSIEGSVLHLPASKLQCSITGSSCGGFTVLTAVNSNQDAVVWTVFENALMNSAVPNVKPKTSKRCFFLVLLRNLYRFGFFCNTHLQRKRTAGLLF